MEILQMDVGGKFAHFRKYYANNTALSFSIPPRTTIMGMLAGILGRPKDEYYQELASERIRIGIRLMKPIKKTFHRLNLLSIKSTKDFRGQNGHIQTPFEVVSGLDLRTDEVVYRFYISYNPDGLETYRELKEVLLQRKNKFTLSFGTANFTASVKSVRIYDDSRIKEIHSGERLIIHSAIPSEAIEELFFDRDSPVNDMQYIEEELLPADFIADRNRELRKMNRLVFSTTGHGIEVRLSYPYFEITDTDVQHIMFME